MSKVRRGGQMRPLDQFLLALRLLTEFAHIDRDGTSFTILCDYNFII